LSAGELFSNVPESAIELAPGFAQLVDDRSLRFKRRLWKYE
jgi:hypothetical protein